MTTVAIDGQRWLIDGAATHENRSFAGRSIEGLLLNSRMANGLFDDANPLTRPLWRYPDTREWSADRNTDELIEQLPDYRAHGLDAICVNLQGASPLGYYRSDPDSLDALIERIDPEHRGTPRSEIWQGLPDTGSQPWNSGAFDSDGSLRPAWMSRAERLLRAVDEAGMVTVLGLFYFGQDERLADETAVIRAVENSCAWVLETGFENVVIEVNNECNVPRYEHPILTPPRVHELIELVKSIEHRGRRLLAGTSFTRASTPPGAVIAASDLILLHGNGVEDPAEIGSLVSQVREAAEYRGQPVFFNEDDHFEFDKPTNNFTVALAHRAGWGFFDPGTGAGGRAAFGDYEQGYQNPPVNWGINNARKRAFFDKLREVTGGGA